MKYIFKSLIIHFHEISAGPVMNIFISSVACRVALSKNLLAVGTIIFCYIDFDMILNISNISSS